MKRAILWLAPTMLAVTAAVLLTFRLSPWPSIAIISYMFSRNDRALNAALARDVPEGIATRTDLAYGPTRGERFDISYPEALQGPLPTIIWIHGGGWIAGDKVGVSNYLKILASHRYTTVGLDYSAGSVYPRPVEEVNTALGFLSRNAATFHIDPARLVIAGDSAGAQIAAQVALITTDRAYAREMGILPELKPRQIQAMLLLSGAYDLTAIQAGHSDFLNTVLWAYSGTQDFWKNERFRLFSVTANVTAKFPPSFISSGNGDPLEPQAVALAQKLRTLGIPVEPLFFPVNYSPPLPHEYQFNLATPAGQLALRRMVTFLERIRVSRNL
jgi:acetyl esterase